MSLVVSGDQIRLLTFDRPDHLNAFNRDLWQRFRDALQEAAEEPQVKAVVVTGNGRAFTSGQDLSEMESMVAEGDGNLPAQVMELLIDYPLPLISAVNGVAAGFGLGLVAHSDLVVMAESARLGAPFVGIGLAMDAGMSHLLPQRIGYSRAAHLFLTGGWLSSAEALESGLATARVADGEALATALALTEKMAPHPASALRATKRLMVEARRDAVRTALAREEKTLHELAAGPDHRERVAAFLGKRSA